MSINKVEQTAKNIRVPVPGEEGKHTGDKIRTIIIDKDKGIKALYCIDHKKIITYIFAKNKGWDIKKAVKWVKDHVKIKKMLKEYYEDDNDTSKDFLKIMAVYEDGTITEYLPNSESFILTKDIEAITTGVDMEKVKGEGQEVEMKNTDVSHDSNIKQKKEKEMEIIKTNKKKQIVYGVFLVPEKADHDGDVISLEDVEKVAHGFIVEYREVDEMHKQLIDADIVESTIAWKDNLDYYGKKLKEGTWFGAVHIKDKKVWEKVEAGIYGAFSVRIAGEREPIKEKEKEERELIKEGLNARG